MSLTEKFISHLKQFPFVRKEQTYLLAISGGVDSVVLCDLIAKAGHDFFIAHCNFQLRGTESERDEQSVRKLAEKYNKPVLVERFETEAYAHEKKLSIQVAARDLRYNWFRTVTHLNKTFDVIITAHHADDNIETVAMNFFRGTGLKGLIGMDAMYKGIFRPLLPFRKEEIIDYAKEHNLDYVEDSSNANSYYTRNYFRNDLLPAISKVFPEVEGNVLKNIQRLSEVEQVYNQAIAEFKKDLVEPKGEEERIPILKLQKHKFFRTIVWEITKEKGFNAAQVNEVIKLMNGDNGSYIDSKVWRIIKNRKWLIIAPLIHDKEAQHLIIDSGDKKVKFERGELTIESNIPIANFSISTDKNIAAVDAKEIQFPLLLRKWKQGDYFYPLGMQKKKKLSKFFIDQKLSKTDKENVWVLEMNKKIVWIIGHRIDDRFKVVPSTKEVVKFIFNS